MFMCMLLFVLPNVHHIYVYISVIRLNHRSILVIFPSHILEMLV